MTVDWIASPIAFEVGDFSVRWYSIAHICNFLVGYALTRWQFIRAGGRERDTDIILVFTVIATLVGGRWGHLLFYEFDRVMSDPAVLFSFGEGGLASHGSTLAFILMITIFSRWRGVSFLDVADRMSFAGAFGAGIIRLGNLMNSEIVGRPTDQSWGFRFPRYDGAQTELLRHPSQIYEFVMGMAILGVLFVVDRRFGERRPKGLIWSLFVGLYFTGRFAVEFFKEYQTLAAGGLTMGQWLSVPLALGGWAGVVLSLKYGKAPERWPEKE